MSSHMKPHDSDTVPKEKPDSDGTAESKNSASSTNSKNGQFRKRKADDFRPNDRKRNFNAMEAKFHYGNYDRYYGKRAISVGYLKDDSKNYASLDDYMYDPRLSYFKRHWFEKKKILDVGCNVGFMTMAIARLFSPVSIIGIDIDGNLIRTAINIRRKKLGHHGNNSKEKGESSKGQDSASADAKKEAEDVISAMNRVRFEQENYVLANDELLDSVKPEYDVILALSLTKWIHLNWGDDGMKRFFRRLYRHLNPGGILILEPQPWSGYKRRRGLTPEIAKNYNSIKFRPDRFRPYLMNELGFESYEVINKVEDEAKGFSRPIYLFQKSTAADSSSESKPADVKDEGEHSSIESKQEASTDEGEHSKSNGEAVA